MTHWVSLCTKISKIFKTFNAILLNKIWGWNAMRFPLNYLLSEQNIISRLSTFYHLVQQELQMCLMTIRTTIATDPEDRPFTFLIAHRHIPDEGKYLLCLLFCWACLCVYEVLLRTETDNWAMWGQVPQQQLNWSRLPESWNLAAKHHL